MARTWEYDTAGFREDQSGWRKPEDSDPTADGDAVWSMPDAVEAWRREKTRFTPMTGNEIAEARRRMLEEAGLPPDPETTMPESMTAHQTARGSTPAASKLSVCAICRAADWETRHPCNLTSVSELLDQSGVQQLTSEPAYSGKLATDRRVPIWSCDHSHTTRADAELCAKATLGQLRDPGSDLRQLPRPRPDQVKESAGVHAPIPGLSNSAWSEILNVFNGTCRYCGASGNLEREHRIPMSRNGINRIENIVPACKQCNLAKGTATEDEFIVSLRQLWGKRARPAPHNMEERLVAIERRFALGAIEQRSTTLLRSLRVPQSAWPGRVPFEAELTVHRGDAVPVAGSSHRLPELQSILGQRSQWVGYGALIPEPTNPHDGTAVMIWVNGKHIGFLQAEQARLIHDELMALLKRGIAVAARTTVFRTANGTGARVKLSIPLETGTA